MVRNNIKKHGFTEASQKRIDNPYTIYGTITGGGYSGSFIGGNSTNTIISSDYSAIVGGQNNTITSSYSFIGSGSVISGRHSQIGRYTPNIETYETTQTIGVEMAQDAQHNQFAREAIKRTMVEELVNQMMDDDCFDFYNVSDNLTLGETVRCRIKVEKPDGALR